MIQMISATNDRAEKIASPSILTAGAVLGEACPPVGRTGEAKRLVRREV
jgi:hypothetical protein